MEHDTHRKLLEAVYQYVKVNIAWETKETHLAGAESRKILSEIRRLASTRRAEIQDIRNKKPKLKSPNYKPDSGNEDQDID
jgi:hypothetical protein